MEELPNEVALADGENARDARTANHGGLGEAATRHADRAEKTKSRTTLRYPPCSPTHLTG
jgi:hypothetical protein